MFDWGGECRDQGTAVSFRAGGFSHLFSDGRAHSSSNPPQDIPPFHVVAGNPARILRKIATAMDPEQTGVEDGAAAATEDVEGAEVPMAEASR